MYCSDPDDPVDQFPRHGARDVCLLYQRLQVCRISKRVLSPGTVQYSVGSQRKEKPVKNKTGGQDTPGIAEGTDET